MDWDIQLVIELRDDQRTLAFKLSSRLVELEYFNTLVGTTQLTASARELVTRLFAELSELARHDTRQGPAALQRDMINQLEGIGQRLYRDLLPDQLKMAYRRMRQVRTVQPLTLLLMSDEPWIPWELVKPYEEVFVAGGELEIIDDPFWCEAFFLTRWLPGAWPAQVLQIDQVAVVLPASSLVYSQHELDYLGQLSAQQAGPSLTSLSTCSAVKNQFAAGQTQLWHFACHGDFVGADPDASAVHLDDGRFEPDDIIGVVESGVRRARPMVVLNACHTGRSDFALTGIGGWASRFLRAGATTFVGTQWEARDDLAAEFMVTCYTALAGGVPLGQAIHTARMQVKAHDPGNPTWLSYVVYGNPTLNMQVPQAVPRATVNPWMPITSDEFLFLGQGLSADEFTQYVSTYDFGNTKPDFVVLHHTATPSTRYARFPTQAVWDADEAGLSEPAIKAKRSRQLKALKEQFRTELAYDRGSHLYIDDRYIWLFTPMSQLGLNAAEGSSYVDAGGDLHYSISIHVIGYYEYLRWPEPVEGLVGHCLAVLKQRLGTFDFKHQRGAGGLSSHRDYGKQSCPGAGITDSYYIGVAEAGWSRLTRTQVPVGTASEP